MTSNSGSGGWRVVVLVAMTLAAREASSMTFRPISDENLVASIIAILAHCKRLPALARFAMLGESERQDALNELGWA